MKKAGIRSKGQKSNKVLQSNNVFLWIFIVIFVALLLINVAVIYKLSLARTIAKSVTAKASSTQANIQLIVENVTPVPTPTPTPAPSGAGGVAPAKRFLVDKAELKAKLKQGESSIKTLTITNNGELALNFNLEIQNLKDYLTLSSSSFSLAKGDAKTLSLIFIIPEDAEAGVYTGKIIIQGDSIRKTVNIIIEVVTKRVLFDVKLDIPKQFKEILPGQEISAQVTIINLGEVPGKNTIFVYKIMDMEGKTILENTSLVDIEKQFSSAVSFILPKTIKLGDYVFSAEVLYEDSVAVASDTFEVVAEIEFPLRKDYLMYIIIFLVILIFIIIMYLNYRKLRKIEKKHRKLREKFEKEE